MKSLSDLNTAGSTQIEYEDARSARAVLTKKYVNDVEVEITSTSVSPVYKTDIEEIINYSTAAVEFSVEIKSDSSPALTGSSIAFPTLPAYMSSSTVGTKTTLTGFESARDWETVKNFTWTLPSGYATVVNFYLELTISWYDAATASTVSEEWYLYDPLYFGQIFKTVSTMSAATANAIKRVDETLAVVSTISADAFIEARGELDSAFTLAADIEVFQNIDDIDVAFGISVTANYAAGPSLTLNTNTTITPNTNRDYQWVDSLHGYSQGNIWGNGDYNRLTTQISLNNDASEIVFNRANYTSGSISSWTGYHVDFDGTSFGTPTTQNVGAYLNDMSADGTYVFGVDYWNYNLKIYELQSGSYSLANDVGLPSLPFGESFTRWLGIAVSADGTKAAAIWEGSTDNFLTVYSYNTGTNTITEDTRIALGITIGDFITSGNSYYFDHASLYIGYAEDTSTYHIAYHTANADLNRTVKVRNSSDNYATEQQIISLGANTTAATLGPQSVYMDKNASQIIVMQGGASTEVWSRSVNNTWSFESDTDAFIYLYNLDSEYARHPWSIAITDRGDTVYTSSVTEGSLSNTYPDDGTYMDFLSEIPSGFVKIATDPTQADYQPVAEIAYDASAPTAIGNDFAFGHVVKITPDGKYMIVATDDSLHIYRDQNTG